MVHTVTTASGGDHRFRLNGRELIATADGALVWPDAGLLAVADLHLEKGSGFALRGSLLPPYDTAATLDRLEGVLRRWRPRRVLCLGDSFHDRAADQRLSDHDRARLVRLSDTHDWRWIEGNHDPDPPSGVGGARAAEIVEEGVAFRHQAANGPTRTDGTLEVSGHWHPAAIAATRAGRVRARCFAVSGHRLILPAFGAYTGGLNVRDPALAPYLDATTAFAILIRDRRAVAFPLARLLPDRQEKARRVGGNPSGAK